ncbi:MAG: hypothetical protein WCA77_07860 [Thermoplasmata archaeon]
MGQPSAEWRTCSYCGEAAPPTGSQCPTCGHDVLVAKNRATGLTKREGTRFRFVQSLRILIVIAAVVGLTYAMVSAALTGPPSVADPLTTRGTYTIAPGNFSYLNGSITGEDYVQGNFTVVEPFGTDVSVQVFNSSEFTLFAENLPTTSQWSSGPHNSGPIVFSAPYTDNFYFVFSNVYPVGSGLTVKVFVVTTYEANTVIAG